MKQESNQIVAPTLREVLSYGQKRVRPEKAPSYKGLVFVSVPSKGIVRRETMRDTSDGTIVLDRPEWEFTEAFLRLMAQLRVESPDAEFFSPSLQNYQILPFMPPDTPATYWAWKKRCEIGLRKSDMMLVCPFGGWQTSEGVQDEITMALEMKTPIYMDVERPCYGD